MAADKNGNVITPIFTSANVASYITMGNPITYTATSSTSNVKFIVQDDDGSAVTINYNTGIMTGGTTALVGTYTIILRCGNTLGLSAKFNLSWTLNP